MTSSHAWNESTYTPLSCSLHDRLEAAGTLKRRVLLRYQATGDEQIEENAEIADIQTRGGAEYVVLSSGSQIRLDRIISLDGLLFRAGTTTSR